MERGCASVSKQLIPSFTRKIQLCFIARICSLHHFGSFIYTVGQKAVWHQLFRQKFRFNSFSFPNWSSYVLYIVAGYQMVCWPSFICWNFGKNQLIISWFLYVIYPTTTNLYTNLDSIYLTYNYSGTLVFIAVELMLTIYHLYVSPNVSTVQYRVELTLASTRAQNLSVACY